MKATCVECGNEYEKRTSTKTCGLECRAKRRREAFRKYHADHPEKQREYNAKHRAAHPEDRREAQRKYYARNAEKLREYHRQQYTFRRRRQAGAS